jgi:hypothetical protein
MIFELCAVEHTVIIVRLPKLRCSLQERAPFLGRCGLIGPMSAIGNPHDNAQVESFMKTPDSSRDFTLRMGRMEDG